MVPPPESPDTDPRGSWLPQWWQGSLARLRALTRRNAIRDEIQEEMRFHVDMRTAELEQNGLATAEAQRAARRRFGNLTVMQDRGYDVRGGGLMETIAQDVRFGLRLLVKQRGFSLIAVLTLALGIGLTTALFSVIDAALLRPLPYPDPEQLVEVEVEVPDGSGGTSRYAPSVDDIRQWRSAGSVLSHIGAGRAGGFTPRIVDAGTPERLRVADPTEDFLDTYGIRPILGRSVIEDDTREGAPAVAVLGHSYWQTRFGGDADVLGRTIRIDGDQTTIIGVLPRGFYPETAVWRPQQSSPAFARRRGSGKPVVGRLKPGVSLEAAAAELTRIAAPDVIHGPTPVAPRIILTSLYDSETSAYGTTIKTLAWAVGLILLIACVNVTGLLLARGATRQGELAIRASIGAGRGRLVRQMLTESLILALAAGALGVLCAWLALDALVAILPLSLPENSPASINLPVMLGALAIAIVTAVVIGLLPALSLSRAAGRLGSYLSAANQRVGTPLSRRRGQVLVALQVALALILLSGSGLAARSLARLLAVDVGFDPDRVLTMEVEPLDQSAHVRAHYYPELVRALRAVPGMEAVGTIEQRALHGGSAFVGMKTEAGVTFDGPQRTVLAGYFEALGVRPIAGRLLTDSDPAVGESPVVINEIGARQYFEGAAVGHTLHTTGNGARHFRIVGVVAHIRHNGPEGRVRPEMYMLPAPPIAGATADPLGVVMRLRTSASAPPQRLRDIAESIGPRVLVGPIRPATDLLGERVARPRNRTLLFGLLGIVGLTLTLVGIFSVTAYSVTRRTREIGIRTAFGAGPGRLVAGFVGDAAKPAAIGMLAGLACAYYATQMLTPFLFQTAPGEPATLASVAIVVGLSACLAAWIPARRATKIDPVTALRVE